MGKAENRSGKENKSHKIYMFASLCLRFTWKRSPNAIVVQEQHIRVIGSDAACTRVKQGFFCDF